MNIKMERSLESSVIKVGKIYLLPVSNFDSVRYKDYTYRLKDGVHVSNYLLTHMLGIELGHTCLRTICGLFIVMAHILVHNIFITYKLLCYVYRSLIWEKSRLTRKFWWKLLKRITVIDVENEAQLRVTDMEINQIHISATDSAVPSGFRWTLLSCSCGQGVVRVGQWWPRQHTAQKYYNFTIEMKLWTKRRLLQYFYLLKWVMFKITFLVISFGASSWWLNWYLTLAEQLVV